jgi:hypothetical protein
LVLKNYWSRVQLDAWERRRALSEQILEVLYRSRKPMSLKELMDATGEGRGKVLQAVRLMQPEGYIKSNPAEWKLRDQNEVRFFLSERTKKQIRRGR